MLWGSRWAKKRSRNTDVSRCEELHHLSSITLFDNFQQFPKRLPHPSSSALSPQSSSWSHLHLDGMQRHSPGTCTGQANWCDWHWHCSSGGAPLAKTTIQKRKKKEKYWKFIMYRPEYRSWNNLERIRAVSFNFRDKLKEIVKQGFKLQTKIFICTLKSVFSHSHFSLNVTDHIWLLVKLSYNAIWYQFVYVDYLQEHVSLLYILQSLLFCCWTSWLYTLPNKWPCKMLKFNFPQRHAYTYALVTQKFPKPHGYSLLEK